MATLLVSGIQFIKQCYASIVTVSNLFANLYQASITVVDDVNVDTISSTTPNSLNTTNLSSDVFTVNGTLSCDTLRIYPYTTTDSPLSIGSGKVGINLPGSATNALEIIGNMKIVFPTSSSGFLVQNPTNFASRIYVNPTTNRVGFGSSSPSAPCYVNGNLTANGIMYNLGNSTTGNWSFNNSGSISGPTSITSDNVIGRRIFIKLPTTNNCFACESISTVKGARFGFWNGIGAYVYDAEVFGNLKYSSELKLPTTTFSNPTTVEDLGYSIKQTVTAVDKLTSPSATFVLATLSIDTGVWLVIPKLDIRGLGASITFTQLLITYKLDGTEVGKWSTYKPIVPGINASPNPQDSLPLEHFIVTNTTTTAKSLTMDIYSEFTGGGSPNGWRINAVTNQCYLQATRIA